MQFINKSVAVFSLSLGLAIGAAVPLVATPNRGFQDGDRYGDRYGYLRQLVDRTQADLRQASQLEHFKGDQRSRFENAQRHLSTFDRHLLKGHFDKGELDDAISDVQHILDKNTLDPGGRDALMRDIGDLRAARERRY